MDRKTLELLGDEIVDVLGLEDLSPRMNMQLVIAVPHGQTDRVPIWGTIDTLDEVSYYRHGGILQYVLRGMAKAA